MYGQEPLKLRKLGLCDTVSRRETGVQYPLLMLQDTTLDSNSISQNVHKFCTEPDFGSELSTTNEFHHYHNQWAIEGKLIDGG